MQPINPFFGGNVKAQNGFITPHHTTNSKIVRVVGATPVSVFGTVNPNFRGTLLTARVFGGTVENNSSEIDIYAIDGTICTIAKGSTFQVRGTGMMINGVHGTAFNSTQLNIRHKPAQSNPEVFVELVWDVWPISDPNV